jgi:pimeloyl-ACP methyl ester carboxylesterase
MRICPQRPVPVDRNSPEATLPRGGVPYRHDNVPSLERLFARTDLTDRPHELRSPTLVLYGQRDALMFAGGEFLMQGLSDATQVRLPGVGHEPFVEAPESAFPAILESLDILQYRSVTSYPLARLGTM